MPFARPLLFQVFLLLSAGIPSVLSALYSGALLPLYVYPGANCEGWSQLVWGFNPPTLPVLIQHYIVINPSNGPGSPGSQPDANYQKCIAYIRTLQQNGIGRGGGEAVILGYVSTASGTRDCTEIQQDIGTYVGWNDAYKPDGIFFDEVEATQTHFQKYQSYSNQVRNQFNESYVSQSWARDYITIKPVGYGQAIFNPGTAPQVDDYYRLADQVVTFEGSYADFHSDGSDLQISPETPVDKQAVILYDAQNLDYPQYQDIVWRLSAIIRVKSSFVTNYTAANAFQHFPDQWNQFLSILVASQTA